MRVGGFVIGGIHKIFEICVGYWELVDVKRWNRYRSIMVTGEGKGGKKEWTSGLVDERVSEWNT